LATAAVALEGVILVTVMSARAADVMTTAPTAAIDATAKEIGGVIGREAPPSKALKA
jgi:hypothetical protein